MPASPDQTPPATVVVIDDDGHVREALGGLFRSVGLRVEVFASVRDYTSSAVVDAPGCLVLDVRLPGQSGLDFFDERRGSGSLPPVIFISGHADVQMSVRAIKAGAIDFFTKPVRDQDLLDAVQIAIERDRARRDEARRTAEVRAGHASLTPREREIMGLVVSGLRNKQIAAACGLTEASVKFHRGHLMRKMGAESLVDLVRMSDLLKAGSPGE
ncbi:response regulator transcription factor [Salinarimonas soli]|uniref:Response regulator transcription factor n=1 Tax=Salinarimonas soli TaxID=1638099 RepID=A0A5B2VI64_9HYPH|nr:response regulator [Salinarimonas soli]KAA2238246.1 response regulator transcription factor [Salinarimonas soli]